MPPSLKGQAILAPSLTHRNLSVWNEGGSKPTGHVGQSIRMLLILEVRLILFLFYNSLKYIQGGVS